MLIPNFYFNYADKFGNDEGLKKAFDFLELIHYFARLFSGF